jgi:hypothetical protein
MPSRYCSLGHRARGSIALTSAVMVLGAFLQGPGVAQDRRSGTTSKVEEIIPPPLLGAGPYFSDSFSGSQLGADWKLMNPDPQAWTLQPKQKSLLIITQEGSLHDSKSLKNWLVLNKDPPSDDYEVITEASIQIQGIGNEVAMSLFSDDQNGFLVSFRGNEEYSSLRRRPLFRKVFQGKNTDFWGEFRAGAAAQSERIFLKIERDGNEYCGFYAFSDKPANTDELKWAKMGTLPWINFHGKLVLYAANLQAAPQVGAEFYSLQIRKK